MNRTYTLVSLLTSLVLFGSATLTFVTSAWGFPETHPLAPVITLVVFTTFVSEIPLIYLSRHLGFPIILPAVSLILALLGLRKGENKLLALVSMILLLASIMLYLSLNSLTSRPGAVERW